MNNNNVIVAICAVVIFLPVAIVSLLQGAIVVTIIALVFALIAVIGALDTKKK